jgi:hypothetical protein
MRLPKTPVKIGKIIWIAQRPEVLEPLMNLVRRMGAAAEVVPGLVEVEVAVPRSKPAVW